MPKTARHNRKFFVWILIAGVVLFICLAIVHKIQKTLTTTELLHAGKTTTILFHSDPPTVLVLSNGGEDLNQLFVFPSDMVVSVPFAYGDYRLDRVWQLGELENKKDLYAQTVEDLLSYHIDAWVGGTDSVTFNPPSSEKMLSQLHSFYNLQAVFDTRILSNLGVLDRLILWWRMSRISIHTTSVLDLTQTDALFSHPKTAIGMPGRYLDMSQFDAKLLGKFEDVSARSEHLSVSVLNATNTPGIAQTFAQFVTRYGANVIVTGNNADDTINNCQIQTNTDRYTTSAIANYLIQTFSCDIRLVSQPLESDIVVLVGEAFAKRWGNTR